MIEDVNVYDCEEKGCGRKFNTREALLSHYQRRHVNLFNKYNDDIPEVIEENGHKGDVDVIDTLTDSQMLSTTSLERVRIITEEMIGIGTKYAGLDEVEEVTDAIIV
jgi:hypothetical protein